LEGIEVVRIMSHIVGSIHKRKVYKGRLPCISMETKCDYCGDKIMDEWNLYHHDDLDVCDSCHEGCIV